MMEVVTAWSKVHEHQRRPDCRRSGVAGRSGDRHVGDIQLFEALAEDDAVCVWHKEACRESSRPTALIDYALMPKGISEKGT